MNAQELTALLDRLCREPHETEWLEFKENHYEPQVLGEYLSALANGAGLAGKPRGYLIFGVQDQTHAVVGTQFDPHAVKAKGNQNLLLWLAFPRLQFGASSQPLTQGCYGIRALSWV
jgi:ATP-dependent DNA helicase RecG